MAVMVMSGIIIMLVYFTAGDDKEVNLGPGNDLFVIKKSSGLHLIEVDNSWSTGVGQGWPWLELVCLGLAILLGITMSHVMHYCYCTKKLVARKVERERANYELSNLPRVAKALGEMIHAALEIPALA